jgi:hypothetical protein
MQSERGHRDFLALWDEGAGRHPLDRAVGLVAQFEGITPDQAAALSIDRRDRALYGIASRLFGDKIGLVATCAECSAETELTFRASDALAVPETPDRIALAGGAAWCRLPTSHDLAAALTADDPEAVLLDRVVVGSSPQARSEAGVVLERQAGLADLELAHRCHRCGAEGTTPFDVLDYLWRRIVAEARRLMREVHVIARAYGWSSEAIVALSPARRAAHLAMIEG